jgi:membrane fusion protein (multidrug efflux system)
VNFGVPQQETARVRIGRKVRITADELSGVEFTGRVTAVDAVVNQETRNVQVQATVPNPDGKLRPGMFVQTSIVTGATRSNVSLPASAISYAPFGDSVFVLAELKGPDGQPYRGVRQQFVKLGPTRGDRVAVLSGITAGDEVVTSGVFKLRNGAAVHVNNKVQPANSASPKLGDS